eukprot:g9108.t1
MDDELDALTREYEKQAKNDLERVLEKTNKTLSAEEKRERALSQKLSEENKGYQLLQKMGYIEGKGLGADKQGIVEPLPIAVKRDRKGIGEQSNPKPKRPKKDTQKSNTAAEYREQVSAKFSSKKVTKRLKTVRFLIESLDSRAELERNPFWLPASKFDDDGIVCGYEEDQIGLMKEADAFAAAVEYLREQHFYCFWCGYQYKDKTELEELCPGPSEDDH